MTLRTLTNVAHAWLSASLPDWFWMDVPVEPIAKRQSAVAVKRSARSLPGPERTAATRQAVTASKQAVIDRILMLDRIRLAHGHESDKPLPRQRLAVVPKTDQPMLPPVFTQDDFKLVRRETHQIVIHQASGDEVISFGDYVMQKCWEHKQRIRAWFIAHGLWANKPDTRPRIWVEPYRDVTKPSINSSTDRVQ